MNPWRAKNSDYDLIRKYFFGHLILEITGGITEKHSSDVSEFSNSLS